MIPLAGQAQQIKPGEFIFFKKDSASVVGIRATNVNVDTLDLWAAMRRTIDSLITARGTGTTARSEIWLRPYVNFSNQANDSVNFQIGVNGVYHVVPLPYDMYLDRFILVTGEPDARDPSVFRDDLPRVTTDSCFIFRLSRNASFAAGQRCAVTVYKVARNTGLSFVNTVGVFYDMIRFDEAVFPAAGTSAQTVLTLSLKKNR